MDIFIHIKLNKSFNDNDTQVLSNKGFPISDKIKKKVLLELNHCSC